MCTTGGRYRWICESIQQFLSQDYRYKKLLIFNNGNGSLHLDPVLKKRGISLVNAGSEFSTYGEVSNAALKLVDTKYMSIWDDDDIYLPNHLSQGVRALEETGKLVHRASRALMATVDDENNLLVDEVRNVLEGTWIINTEFAKRVGFNEDINVGVAIKIVDESNKQNQTVEGEDISYIYRFGNITPTAIHLSVFDDPDARVFWLENHNDYGLGKPLIPHHSNILRDVLITWLNKKG